MRLLILFVLLVAAPPLPAAGLGEWFKSLRQPQTGMSCCDESDCRRLAREDVEIRDGDYWVFNHGRWAKVDEDKILHRPNEAEAPVLCSTPNTIFCFIAWDELS
jgi:hypothetical protein